MMTKDGFLLISKEKGVTSHDVVFKIRKILNTKKTGHAGTLDPNAEGLLIVAVGKATRFIEYLEMMDKSYRAEILFGQSTDTDDITGNVIEKSVSSVKEEDLKKKISGFTGEIIQIPPIYSALKIQGKKACNLARKGEKVQLSGRKIWIYQLLLSDSSQLPDKAIIDVKCSKGTYIRALCRDIGQALSTPACMGNLLRTEIGPFRLSQAVTLSELTDLAAKGQIPFISINEALSHFRSVRLTKRGEKMVVNGCLCYSWSSEAGFDNFKVGEILRFIGTDGFIGIGAFEHGENLENPDFVRPVKILGRN